jgi:spore maturation protein CgeB
MKRLSIVVLGLSITSSWGNGHAVTYRGLLRALSRRGHAVTFLERDVPWYADNRDLPAPPFCRTFLYADLDELRTAYGKLVREADLVIVGSYVPDGAAVGRWAISAARGVVAFYDIDTPVTLASLARGDCDYLSPALIPLYDLYLSFTGGPTLELLERRHGAPLARALYCSVDPEQYFPAEAAADWDLGYLGTYSADRQPKLEELLNGPARALPDRRFVVAGPQYPAELAWPDNVERTPHVPPGGHRGFYSRQRFTLNLTRADMAAAGWSPSVRLFEAAACAAAIVSDWQPGIDEFFRPGEDILIARSSEEVSKLLRDTPEPARRRLGASARARALARHTADRRAAELERHYVDALAQRTSAA